LNPGSAYLEERGLSQETASAHGVEIEFSPQADRVTERLGKGCAPLWNYAEQIIWFPVKNAAGSTASWIARALPTLQGYPKFLTPIGGSGPPFISKSVYDSRKGSPIIITEGPVKALVVAQAGVSGNCAERRLVRPGSWR
jgi:hypothetical protein